MIVYDKLTNSLRNSKDIEFTEKIISLRSLGKHWEVIDAIVDFWMLRNPKKYNSFIVDMEEKRSTRSNSSATNKNKTLRSLVDVPEDIIYLIRKVYNAEELLMDKEFFETMYKRYPAMRVAEKL